MKTILVVGGAGYVGSHVNKLLKSSHYQSIVFDNFSRGSKKTIENTFFCEGDLQNLQNLEEVFSQFSFSAVMHFAAFTDVGESILDPAKYYKNNVVNTLNLLETMRKFHVNKLVFSSSAAIFGLPQEKLIKEDHPVHPINPYGRTKLMIEEILHDYSNAYNFRSISLRYFNAAGGDPEKKIKYYVTKPNNLIPIVLNALKNDHSVIINGTDYPTVDGTCIRDYIHIDDLGQAHLLALEKLLNEGSTDFYNLGNGRGYSVKEVIASAEKITGLKAKTVEGPRRPGDPPYLLADSQKAIVHLGWQPKYPDLDIMIEHAWKALP